MSESEFVEGLKEVQKELSEKLKPGTMVIEFFKDEVLIADPEIAEVVGNSRVEFKAIGVDVTVFLPHAKLTLENEKVPDPYSFLLKAGSSKTFVAANEDTIVAYTAYRQVFGGYVEALSRPPVIIIRKVDI
jgi:hypothetical protein